MLSGPLPNADNFFIIADYHLGNVFQFDATTGLTSQLLPVGLARNPTSLVHDPTAKLIYWADSYVHSINRYSLLTNTSTMIYRDPFRAGKVRLLSSLQLTVTYSRSSVSLRLAGCTL